MRFANKVIVAVGQTDSVSISEGLEKLTGMSFLLNCEIHFVHVFKTINYAAVFGDYTAVYPVEADNTLVENAVLASLVKITKYALPPGFEGKIIHKCLFSENPKVEFCDYVEETKADLVIVPTRKKRGLFESSFAQYVSKHTSVNMILLKSH